MNVSCEVIQDLLPLYEDGVCSQASRALVEEHLRTCQDCAAVRKAMEQPIEPPPVEVDEANPLRALKRVTQKRRVALCCACAALVTLLGIFLFVALRFGWVSNVPPEQVELLQTVENENGSRTLSLQISCNGWALLGREVTQDVQQNADGSAVVMLSLRREWRLIHLQKEEREQLSQGYENFDVTVPSNTRLIIFVASDTGKWETLWEKDGVQ